MSEVESVIFSTGDIQREVQSTKTKCTTSAAKELLKNGILVETSKGLVCMSLKDALSKGVGGHNLSVEDFQTVATKLLFQEEPEHLVLAESASLRADISLDSRKGHKLIKKTKTSTTKIPVVSLVPVPDAFTSSQVDLEDFKCIHNSLLGVSSPDHSLTDKLEAETKGNIMTVTERNTLKLGESINKQPLVNKRSLIIKNNIKPVISVQKMVMNKTETKGESNSVGSILINSGCRTIEPGLVHESYMSCEETSDNSEVASFVANKAENKPVKKRGGWPKGRKRKPEIKYEIRPPKAPATGYVIFLNEKRKDYRDMPFTELNFQQSHISEETASSIADGDRLEKKENVLKKSAFQVTKLLGNEWSKLNLQEKKVYLDQAEVEKKRYREELKAYRQSDAYQSYLHKKRLKKLQGHGTEESDMDATDEIDEEDNEELYCRSCDQWFHSLHNKKEHLYGRQHLQSIAGKYSSKLSDPDWCNANMSSTSLDESSLDGSSYLKGSKEHCCNKSKDSLNMDDVIVSFMVANKEREEESKILRKKLDESKSRNQSLSQELQKLNETVEGLTCMMESERTTQILLEQRLFNLLNVPTLFYLPEPLSEDNN